MTMSYISESKGKVQRAVHLHSQSDHPCQHLGIPSPYGLTTNSEGHIIVVEERASVFTPEGMKIRLFGSNGSANCQFYGTT